jgi:hypothetical protein
MTNFVAHNSRWRIALLTLVAVGFVAGGLWMVGAFGTVPTSRRYSASLTIALGWFTILFFGMAASYGVKKFFDNKPQLEVGPSGIRWTPWSDDLIPWSHITDVSAWSQQRQNYILLHLDDPSRFPGKGLAGKLARANKMMTGGDIAISVTATDRSFGEAMDAVARFRASSG